MSVFKSRGWFLLILAMAMLLPGTALAQDPREETQLQLATPDDVPLGNTARIIAVLRDSQDRPIPDATIIFTTPASFAGTIAEMQAGEAVTDAEGMATLDYQLRAQGQNQFNARFHGSNAYRPAEASAQVLAVGTAQLSQRSAGVEVPILGPWAIVLVLIGVWSVYLVAMVLVSQIPDAASDRSRR